MVGLFASAFSHIKALNELISFWVIGPLRLSMTRAAPGSRPKPRQTASEGTQYLIISTANLKNDFPGYDSGGYELAGFVWYQGWNDGCDPKNAVPEYEANLANLIKDLRKDLLASKLPVVVGELTGPWVQAEGAWAALRQAQAGAAARPEFKGTVRFVETHDFVRKPEDSPCPGHGHHEFANAETYFLVGNALGQGMKKLLQADHTLPTPDPAKPASHAVGSIEGWTVRIDDRPIQMMFTKGCTIESQ
jgi:hypothetical protein